MTKQIRWSVFSVFGVFAWMIFFQSALAEVRWLPESRDQQFRTFGLFIDNQTSILSLPSGNRFWLALGEQFAFFEMNDWRGSPQVVVFTSINAGDRMNGAGNTLLMETIDIRAGAVFEWNMDSSERISLGWMHQSGHTSDDVLDQDLVHPNLGNEQLLIRWFRDYHEKFRWGGTLKPYLGSDPGILRFASDQFFEWMPWGTSPRSDRFTPYFAGGLEQYGADKIHVTYHAQLGAFIGNHWKPAYQPNLRIAAGYYNGVDPRLKYAQFKDGLQRFCYLGVQVGL